MFAKLLKYDFKATWGLLGVLSLIALGAGAMGSCVVRLLNQAPSDSFWMTMLILAMVGVVFYLVAYSLASMLILLSRFYKSRFTDEGYMTFTLPVTNHQILLSSFLNCTLGMIVSMIVTAVSFAILVFFGVEDLDGERWAFIKLCFDYLPDLMEQIGAGNLLVFILMLLSAFAGEIMTIMLSITLGSILVKKHKLLMAIVFYYGIHMLLSIINSFVMYSSVLRGVTEMVQKTFLHFGGILILENVLLALVCYFAMYYLTSRKLNLN